MCVCVCVFYRCSGEDGHHEQRRGVWPESINVLMGLRVTATMDDELELELELFVHEVMANLDPVHTKYRNLLAWSLSL